jgi:hypothetical protein
MERAQACTDLAVHAAYFCTTRSAEMIGGARHFLQALARIIHERFCWNRRLELSNVEC